MLGLDFEIEDRRALLSGTASAGLSMTCSASSEIVETMAANPHDDPVLTRFRAAVTDFHGERLERIVLFGSRARGDANPDSDYDIAALIKGAGTFADESTHLSTVSTEIPLDTGAVISAMPFPAGAYRDRTGFMHELRQDGLDL